MCNLVKIKGADENTYILSFIFCIYKLPVVIQIQWNISFTFGAPLVNGHLHSGVKKISPEKRPNILCICYLFWRSYWRERGTFSGSRNLGLSFLASVLRVSPESWIEVPLYTTERGFLLRSGPVLSCCYVRRLLKVCLVQLYFSQGLV